MGGLLGAAIAVAARGRGHRPESFQRRPLPSLTHAELTQQLRRYDVFIHAAADTNVDRGELNPDACYRDNLLLTELLAHAAACAPVRFVFISSCGVYGNHSRSAYAEYDATHPTTHHHRSKLLAEDAARRLAPACLIVRTGWLFGGKIDAPRNFVARRIAEAMLAAHQGRALKANSAQRGNPCSVDDVAERILTLLDAECIGTFNCVNEGAASRFEYVQAIVQLAGIPTPVLAAAPREFTRPALVPDNEAARNWRAEALGFAPMRDWRTALAAYIASLSIQLDIPPDNTNHAD